MGDSPNAYFIGREVRTDRFEPALQVIPGGSATDVDIGAPKFRDKSTGLAKQGARFRIFCYQYAQVGSARDTHPVDHWEVTAADYEIEWRVKLANKKSHDIPPVTSPRPSGATWLWDAGPNEPAERKFSTAAGGGALQKFDGVTDRLPLGSAFLEPGGQLVVLGSDGMSRKIPHRTAAIAPSLTSLRWDYWEDDAADGYIAATVTPRKHVSGKADKNEPAQTARKATIVIAMPQYAVDLDPVVTLYHFALNSALINRGSPPFSKKLRDEITYADDIQPIVKGYASYKFVSDEARRGLADPTGTTPPTTGHDGPSDARLSPNDFYRSAPPSDLARLLFGYLREAWPTKWQRYEDYWDDGADPRPVVYKQELRSKMPNLEYLAYPQHLMLWMKRWASASIPSLSKGTPPVPMQLDMAHLCSMAGGSFYPGIEVGRTASQFKLWTADYGVSARHVDLRYGGAVGTLTERLALPWQADYASCGREWWPGSRPVVVKHPAHGFYSWMYDGTAPLTGPDLISKWTKLGFIRFQAASHEYHEDSRLLTPGPPP
jgi:hypothetical protein